jgi:hypothetical protein
VVNISNPSAPVVTGTYSWAANTTSVYGCAYFNGLVFMAGQSRGLGILDVGNGVSGGTAAVPVLAYDEGGTATCSVANSCKSFGVAVDGANSIVYVTDFSTATPWTYRQLKAYSYAGSITAPTLLQNLTLPANTKSLGVTLNLVSKTAYITDTNQTLIDVVDITNVATAGMTNLSTFAPTGSGRIFNSQFTAVPSQTSNLVYLPSGSATTPPQIDVFDLTNRSAPLYLNTIAGPGASSTFGGVALDPRGGYIYDGDYGNGTTGSALDVFTTPVEAQISGSNLASTYEAKNYLQLDGSTSGNIKLNAGAAPTVHTVILPPTVCTSGQTWTDNGSGVMACTSLATSSTAVSGETPSGTPNNALTTFGLAHTPLANTLRLYIDGTRTTAFTLATATITMTTAPKYGQTLTADYAY